jgi:hypothetical protein
MRVRKSVKNLSVQRRAKWRQHRQEMRQSRDLQEDEDAPLRTKVYESESSRSQSLPFVNASCLPSGSVFRL